MVRSNADAELLRSYRIAHARVGTIETFEASLRENTPLTSISDPSAFVEYLNQVNRKGDMVMDELKRVSKERDELNKNFEEAERRAKDASEEVARLQSLTTGASESEDTLESANNPSERAHKPMDSLESDTIKSP